MSELNLIGASSNSVRAAKTCWSGQPENYASPSAERLIRENLALKQRGQLDASRGSSHKRSLATSWRYALDHFDETRRLLTEVPPACALKGFSPSFCDFVCHTRNLWIYASNIVEFTYSQMRLNHPDNAVIVSVVYPGQMQLLDLAPFGDRPIDVRYEIPLAASAAGEDLIPNETPSITPDHEARARRAVSGAARFSRTRIVDLGCGRGRLAAALASTSIPQRTITA